MGGAVPYMHARADQQCNFDQGPAQARRRPARSTVKATGVRPGARALASHIRSTLSSFPRCVHTDCAAPIYRGPSVDPLLMGVVIDLRRTRVFNYVCSRREDEEEEGAFENSSRGWESNPGPRRARRAIEPQDYRGRAFGRLRHVLVLGGI